MTCESANITIQFPNIDLEIRPLTLDFQRDEGLLDSLRTKFSGGVADYLEPETKDSGWLTVERPVNVAFDGEPIFRMLYVPDGIRFGTHNVHIQFYDLRRSLTHGTVDMQRDSVTLEDAYRAVFNAVPEESRNFFTGIKFSVPDEAYDELLAERDDRWALGGKPVDEEVQQMVNEEWQDDNPERQGSYEVPPAKMDQYIREIERRRVYNVIDGHLAVDFEQIAPYDAMQELNEKFRVQTWVGVDGALWVGSPEATGFGHIATADDERVWRITDHSLNPPTEPVRQAIVRGKWVDDPDEGMGERVKEGFPFVGGDNAAGKDYRAEGVAYKDGVVYGRDASPIEVEASRDMLPALAEQYLKDEIKSSWSGELEILPSRSGTVASDPRFVRIGDSVIVIPPEADDDDCDWPVEQGVYLVTGFRHQVTESGEWTLKLSVIPYPEVGLPPGVDIRNEVELLFHNTKSYLRYFDPSASEYITDDAFESSEDSGRAAWLRG